MSFPFFLKKFIYFKIYTINMDFHKLKVSDIGEKGLIKEILSNFNDIIDDDAAITHISEDIDLISSCDMLIQSKHFPKEMSFYQMGFKSVTVNVSDLAAMGTEPTGFLLSIAIPKNFLVESFKEIIKGVSDACDFYNINLIGGDTNEADEIIISGTAFGLSNSNSLMKFGFIESDLICITGDIGLASLGFNLLNMDFSNDLSKIAIKKALSPIARVKEGLILKEVGASSTTDITDGLASELYELLEADRKHIVSNSSKGMIIYENKLEISSEFKNIAKLLNLNYLDLILHIGEDFELLFTISPSKIKLLKDKMDFKVIGEINFSNKIEIKLANGDLVELSSRGYDHLK